MMVPINPQTTNHSSTSRTTITVLVVASQRDGQQIELVSDNCDRSVLGSSLSTCGSREGAPIAQLFSSRTPDYFHTPRPVAVPSVELIEAPGASVSCEDPKQGLACTVLIKPISGSRHEEATDADSPALRIDVYSPELARIL